jgi:predicted CoA-substrate-specific enzyme activase
MVGYVCKYTPIKILEGFGEKPYRISACAENFCVSDALMHPNMCSYAKAVLEECMNSDLDKIVLTDCCDSIKRLFDVIKEQGKFKFAYMMNIPKKVDCPAVEVFKSELSNFVKEFEAFSGNTFDILSLKNSGRAFVPRRNCSAGTNIALVGARCEDWILHILKKAGASVAYDFTCTSEEHLMIQIPEEINEPDDILHAYAKELLLQYPCMRMADADERMNRLNTLVQNKVISGIIFHQVKFCDLYSFDYAHLISTLQIPVLKIETDYTEESLGQIKTRVEAFLETLNKTNNEPDKEDTVAGKFHYFGKTAIVAGIDSGSTSTNVVIIDNNKNILASHTVKTGAKSIESAYKSFNEALIKAGIQKEDVDFIISTGYGRVSIPFADQNVTEITCHAKAAYFINSDTRTIIDIGGQDSKVIRLDSSGNVKDFSMNDKCAAGTGRFLEMMARTLEISIESMGEESLKWKEDIDITSMCTVFAESEVISLIAENKDKADIIHGISKSIANRIFSHIGRLGEQGGYMMTGGVAKNKGVISAIEEKLREKLYIPEKPEIMGALGAALIALEKAENQRKAPYRTEGEVLLDRQ